ncbi:hypothetical protein Dester_0846 [Desulfurobacterium thermolithotrophum DSM 11699]|uniref:Uncharacterized protein n=1 Tax=Desulfurobacterium thermolithotrophum (strain DSM 11699 / BSA) TaxID=868864 RepID=F0S3R4_DESTD|nr:hypothetical protein [Desulfurobacterium thermolithotrophum]ADY73486.1 hypothetical protein Dester_0846 [Desulfurobacterium thermolithotrophum DSM 11699]
MNSLLKAFFVYAYSFVAIFMLNSLIIALLLKVGVSLTFGRVFSFIITPLVLFFTYKISVKKFIDFPIDEEKISKAWLFQFIPFFLVSLVLFRILSTLIPKPSLMVFVFLNLELFVIYITFKFSVEKILKTKGKERR